MLTVAQLSLFGAMGRLDVGLPGGLPLWMLDSLEGIPHMMGVAQRFARAIDSDWSDTR